MRLKDLKENTKKGEKDFTIKTFEVRKIPEILNKWSPELKDWAYTEYLKFKRWGLTLLIISII